MAAPRVEECAGGQCAGVPVGASHVRDRRAEFAVDGHQGHADRVVFAQSLVVGAGNDAIDAVSHEKGQVFAFALGSSHRVADEDAVPRLGEGVFDLDGELAEERQGDGGHDETHGLGALAVQGARQRIGTVAQGLDGVGDTALGLL